MQHTEKKEKGKIKSEASNKDKSMHYELLTVNQDNYRFLFENVPMAIVEMNAPELQEYLNQLWQKDIQDFRKYFNENPSSLRLIVSLIKECRVNYNYAQLINASSEKQVENSFYSIISENIPVPDANREVAIGLAEGKPRFNFEIIQPTYDGKLQHQHHEVHVISDPDSGAYKIITAVFDITESKYLIKQLQKANEKEKKLRKEIKRQLTSRAEFTRLLVHELKTPLTPLLVSSDYLVKNLNDELLLSFAKNIQMGAKSLSHRVAELLDLARSEVGMFSIKPKLINPSIILNDIYNYMSPKAKDNQLIFIMDAPPRLPKVKADKERLYQVIINLLDNAFKYTYKDGTVTLRVKIENANIVFSVEDTGLGIEKKFIPKLFQPYTKPKRGKATSSGLGIGLYLCRTIVEHHGGTIWVNSTFGKGSTFSFTIPIPPSQIAITKEPN
jgi:signal transduction histidine kinase